jgi:hypothetical protein
MFLCFNVNRFKIVVNTEPFFERLRKSVYYGVRLLMCCKKICWYESSDVTTSFAGCAEAERILQQILGAF